MATIIQENIFLGLSNSSRGLVHCHHGSKHGSIQADAETIGENYVLICRQRERLWTSTTNNLFPPKGVHLLILLILSNISTPWWLRIQVYDPLEVILSQTTTHTERWRWSRKHRKYIKCVSQERRDKGIGPWTEIWGKNAEAKRKPSYMQKLNRGSWKYQISAYDVYKSKNSREEVNATTWAGKKCHSMWTTQLGKPLVRCVLDSEQVCWRNTRRRTWSILWERDVELRLWATFILIVSFLL